MIFAVFDLLLLTLDKLQFLIFISAVLLLITVDFHSTHSV